MSTPHHPRGPMRPSSPSTTRPGEARRRRGAWRKISSYRNSLRPYFVNTLLTPPEISDVTSSSAPAMARPPGGAKRAGPPYRQKLLFELAQPLEGIERLAVTLHHSPELVPCRRERM